MLVISRKPGESILLETQEGIIEVRLAQVSGNNVKLVVSAPKSIAITRKEVYDAVKASNQDAVNTSGQSCSIPKSALKAAQRSQA